VVKGIVYFKFVEIALLYQFYKYIKNIIKKMVRMNVNV